MRIHTSFAISLRREKGTGGGAEPVPDCNCSGAVSDMSCALSGCGLCTFGGKDADEGDEVKAGLMFLRFLDR